jgi:hypothetical protein
MNDYLPIKIYLEWGRSHPGKGEKLYFVPIDHYGNERVHYKLGADGI